MSRFSRYVAQRYLLSNGRLRAVHLVSLVATLAVSLIVMASVVVLSVFNGYGNLLLEGSSPFDPDLLVKSSKDNYLSCTDKRLRKILDEPFIRASVPILYGEGMLVSGGVFCPAKLMGVPSDSVFEDSLSEAIFQGSFKVDDNFSVVGSDLFKALGFRDNDSPILLVLPRRTAKINPLLPQKSLQRWQCFQRGVVYSGNDIYNHTMFLSLDSLQRLMELSKDRISALGLLLSQDDLGSMSLVKNRIRKQLGDDYLILDRQEQHPDLVKLVSMEKLFSYLILSFILFLAGFNVTSASALLILEKQRDLFLFEAIGANSRSVRDIFVRHSFGITLFGAISGLLVGVVLCFVQQSTHLIKLRVGFSQQPYPVSIHFGDLIFLLIIVLVLGFFSAWLPARLLISSSSKQ